jgi:hypothetical protein
MELTMEQQPIRHEFYVDKLTAKGKPIIDEDGNMVKDKFIYDFNELGMDRKLMGRKFFEIADKSLVNLPKEPEHIEILANRRAELYAWSAILIKIGEDGKPELYDPGNILTQYQFSQLGKTEEDWNKLMECKNDFFFKVGLQSSALMMQSNDIMLQSVQILKELTGLASNSGVQGLSEMKEFTKMILEQASNIDKPHGES